MDAAILPGLDQLDFKALKSLILARHEQAFSRRKQLPTQQEEILSQREQLASCDVEIEHLKGADRKTVSQCSSAGHRRSGNIRSNNFNCGWKSWRGDEGKETR